MFKIKNNFVSSNLLKKINSLMTNVNFPWYFQDRITRENDDNKKFYFTHILYSFNKINSQFYESIMPEFIEKLNIKNLLRVKLNLYTQTHKIIEHDYHTDSTTNEPHKTALFYVNDNNGFTIFKKPFKKIKSEKNKCVIFDGSQEHKSTTCTNKLYRLTLNINYEF